MQINKEKNQAYTQYMLGQKHIAEKAFKHGVHDFFNGRMEGIDIPPSVLEIVVKRAQAIMDGNHDYADKIANKLLGMGYYTSDKYEDGELVSTGLNIKTVAYNPYIPDTIYYKEWERGFNIGHKMNLNKEKARNVRKHEKRR